MKIEPSIFTPISSQEAPIESKEIAIPHEKSTLTDVVPQSDEIILLSNTSSISYESLNTSDEILNPNDIFHFGEIWEHVESLHISMEQIIEAIQVTRAYIQQVKEKWRDYCFQEDPVYRDNLSKLMEHGDLYLSPTGAGCAYILKDQQGSPKYIIKPVDEDILCLNNCKLHGNPFLDKHFLTNIPQYRSVISDILSYKVALLLGLDQITPKTNLQILSSTKFHDVSGVLSEDHFSIKDMIGCGDTEKLCSVQEFVPNSVSACDKIYEWMMNGETEETIYQKIRRQDLEDINLLLWITFDGDANGGNFLLQPCEDHEHPESLYRLIKIDNNMTFPEKNTDFCNFLLALDQNREGLSSYLREKIFSIDYLLIAQQMISLDFSCDSISACLERIHIIRELATRETISMYEINLRMLFLGQPNGISLALGTQTLPELEDVLIHSFS
ncbi:MAG: hypothetical protein EBZ47_04155, partial [Chlamydiae bacterium]|nr:hypothetical protein [Chlamydiota bacterium]